MNFYNEKEFIALIREDINPLSFEEFLKTTHIGKQWDRMCTNALYDIRVYTAKTKENYYKWCYDFIHNDEPLKLYFNKRFSYVNLKPFFELINLKPAFPRVRGNRSIKSSNFKPVGIIPIKNNEINNKSNNNRFIRNINLPSLLDCKSYKGDSIKSIYKDALELGKLDSCMTIPSVFKDSYEGNYSTFVVTMKTASGQMSIFSPTIYKSLLVESDKYAESKKQKLLIPSASWASPILATYDSKNYTSLHIVDVQKEVLTTSEKLFDYIHKGGMGGAIFPDYCNGPYELRTFCIPSERMTDEIDKEYDKVFFCPPYYDLELYGGSDLQSTTLYKTYDDWLDLYWRQTVNECDSVLKSGGLFCFVMGHECRKHKIGSDMKKIAEEKFSLLKEIKILPPIESTRDSNKIEKYEICYIMKKETK